MQTKIKTKTVPIDLAMAKIILIGCIEDVIRCAKRNLVENTRDDKYRLIGASYALSLVFGDELNSKIFDAVNHYDLDKSNIKELQAIIEEINLKYPDRELYL